MATVNKLIVGSEEQWLQLSSGYSADIKFDYIYKRWYYDLYFDEALVCAGVALNKDSPTLKGMSPVYLAVVEDNDNNVQFEPFSDLGGILVLMEIVE